MAEFLILFANIIVFSAIMQDHQAVLGFFVTAVVITAAAAAFTKNMKKAEYNLRKAIAFMLIFLLGIICFIQTFPDKDYLKEAARKKEEEICFKNIEKIQAALDKNIDKITWHDEKADMEKLLSAGILTQEHICPTGIKNTYRVAIDKTIYRRKRNKYRVYCRCHGCSRIVVSGDMFDRTIAKDVVEFNKNHKSDPPERIKKVYDSIIESEMRTGAYPAGYSAPGLTKAQKEILITSVIISAINIIIFFV